MNDIDDKDADREHMDLALAGFIFGCIVGAGTALALYVALVD